jgi:hypothetical protein
MEGALDSECGHPNPVPAGRVLARRNPARFARRKTGSSSWREHGGLEPRVQAPPRDMGRQRSCGLVGLSQPKGAEGRWPT